MRLFSLLDTQYKNFSNKVKAYLSKTLSGHSINYGSNTIFGQIITVIGNAIQNVMLYIEDSLTEQNKYTAQRKKSIYGLAALSGYMPSYGKASVASIKLCFIPNNESAYNVILNNKETLTCTQNGLNYNIILPQEAITLNVSQDNSNKYFTAVQGKFESQRFISNGGQYYTVNFKFSGNLDIDYLTVKVNNEIWDYAASFYDMSADSKEYTYSNSIVGGIDLIFGNDTHGRSLQNGDVIDIEYLIHDGEHGNLNPNIETYFVFNDMLKDISGDLYDGNSLFNITFSENDPITAGSNSESVQHVKEMIGLNSRSLVLASPENYKALINRFGFCGYNRTWSDPNAVTIHSLIRKNFKLDLTISTDYFNLTEDDFKLNDFQKSTIYDYINSVGNQLAAVNYRIFDPEICKYALFFYVKLKSGKYNRDLIKNQIIANVGEFFSNIQSDIFIPKSDIIHLLKSNIEGIDGIDLYILSQKNEEAIYKLQYTEDTYVMNNLTGQYVKKTENVRLYPGENPNLGLDNHGNIYLKSNTQFPVIMGGWKYVNDERQEIEIVDPITITFEN
jgi:hypothetical protein